MAHTSPATVRRTDFPERMTTEVLDAFAERHAWERAKAIAAETLGPLDDLVALEITRPAHAAEPVELARALLDAAEVGVEGVTLVEGRLSIDDFGATRSVRVEAAGLYTTLRVIALVSAVLEARRSPLRAALVELGPREDLVVVGPARSLERAVERGLFRAVSPPAIDVEVKRRRAGAKKKPTKKEIEALVTALAAREHEPLRGFDDVVAAASADVVRLVAESMSYADERLSVGPWLAKRGGIAAPSVLLRAAAEGSQAATALLDRIVSLRVPPGDPAVLRFPRLAALDSFLWPTEPRSSVLARWSLTSMKVRPSVFPDLTGMSALEEVHARGPFDGPLVVRSASLRVFRHEGATLDRWPTLATPKLERLEIAQLGDVDAVGFTLPALTTLVVGGTHALTSLRGLDASPALRSVLLTQAFGLSTLDSIAGHPGLASLELPACSVRDFSALATCPSLRRLAISYDTELESLASLAGLRALEELDLRGVTMEGAEVLATLPALRSLCVDEDAELPALPPSVEIRRGL